MTITDLLHFILKRLDLNSPEALVVTADETQHWPADGLDLLIKWGLLMPAKPRTQLICDGCEEQCIMPVEVIPKSGEKSERAFIACDKRDDIDIVPVELERLRQWRIDPSRIAGQLNHLLEIEQTPRIVIQERLWQLGMKEMAKARFEVYFARGLDWADRDRIVNEIASKTISPELFLLSPDKAQHEIGQSHVSIVSLLGVLVVDSDRLLVDSELLENAYRKNRQNLTNTLSPTVHQSQKVQQFLFFADLRWEEVTIAFVSNDSIKIQARDAFERYTFAEIGFKDRRKGDLPDTRWELLRDDFAENYGEVSFKNRKTQCDLKAAVKEINQRLRTIVPIQQNPISYDRKKHVYKTTFKLVDKRYGQ